MALQTRSRENGTGPVEVSAGAGLDSSAGKALALLDAFRDGGAVVGVSDLADRAGMAKSTAHRLLVVLIERGYVRRVNGKYALSSWVFELGNQVPIARTNGLRDRAIPYMTELFARTRTTVHLAVLRGTDILYVDKLYGHDSVHAATTIGARRPAHATGLGKAMLAFASNEDLHRNLSVRYRRFTAYTVATPGNMAQILRRVREEGCATDHEESFLGISCLAAPILDPRTHHAVAALSLTAGTGTGNAALLRHKNLLLGTAQTLSAQLAG
ncbi:IclR family transcriptional regulator [Amycolatopsis sp. GM8]|uniref:IclR family transcriptional regulator n=1 Tax=Amycolatopsis sp. GM8 TaxID=2896530 RepID=UPI001F2E8DD5|nr:IclR family transcriptional regulator [Amycolatopsis sp. GM8]